MSNSPLITSNNTTKVMPILRTPLSEVTCEKSDTSSSWYNKVFSEELEGLETTQEYKTELKRQRSEILERFTPRGENIESNCELETTDEDTEVTDTLLCLARAEAAAAKAEARKSKENAQSVISVTQANIEALQSEVNSLRTRVDTCEVFSPSKNVSRSVSTRRVLKSSSPNHQLTESVNNMNNTGETNIPDNLENDTRPQAQINYRNEAHELHTIDNLYDFIQKIKNERINDLQRIEALEKICSEQQEVLGNIESFGGTAKRKVDSRYMTNAESESTTNESCKLCRVM